MSAATNVTSGSCHFLKIPLELRLMILRRALPYRATKCVPIDNKKGKACESPDEHWVPGSVAILRVSKQVYSEALQELYSNNYFTIIIQPRRVLLEFLPANRKAQPKFGLIKSNDGVDFRTHAGLPMIRYWYLTFSHHSLGGAGKTKLKVAGFQAFMKWLPQKPLALCWGDLRLAGGGTIYRQMVCVLSAVLHHMFIDWQDRAPAFTDEWIKASVQKMLEYVGNARNKYDPNLLEGCVQEGQRLLNQTVSPNVKALQFVTSYTGQRRAKPRV